MEYPVKRSSNDKERKSESETIKETLGNGPKEMAKLAWSRKQEDKRTTPLENGTRN